MATPFVSGVAALVKARHPAFGPAELRAVLLATADDSGDPGYDVYTGWGRVSAARAVAYSELLVAAAGRALRPARAPAPRPRAPAQSSPARG